ncbi:hypothetical protein [Paludisphaera mucosa]|uniref:Uncharacterized protein n=1 Tax=Paludisphaera mucosa TaxID=3030827 RepID=A0ABT6FJC2_9BACT|nr:hypothetical protein [Paludisphaera mucosa]MDG3007673.1 hypothetical protein [Paludisphaera mucosa]
MGVLPLIAAVVLASGCGPGSEVPIAKAPAPPADANPAQPKLPSKDILKNASPKDLNPGKSS